MTKANAAKCIAVLTTMKGTPPWTDAVTDAYFHGFYKDVTDEEGMSATRTTLRSFQFRPSVAELWDIVDRMDGRPGHEEAWAMYPKSELESACVTDEMHEAARAAQHLIDAGDLVAARMSFIEVYKSAVARARRDRVPVSWHVTLGTDRTGHSRAVADMEDRLSLSPDTMSEVRATFGIDPYEGEPTDRSIQESVGKLIEGSKM